jgi:glycosyltransferase involved in cell wall biosynthesis
MAPTVFPIRKDLKYGGAELFMYYLCAELGRREQKYTLYAAKGSQAPGGELVETIEAPNAWGTDEELRSYNSVPEEDWYRHALINDHTHRGFGFELKQLHVVKTLHGVSTWRGLPRNYPRFITLSQYHRDLTRDTFGVDSRIAGLGVDSADYQFNDKADDYYLLFGLMAPHKGHLQAIEVCKKLGLKLIVAGEDKFVPDPGHVDKIKAACDGKDIIFVGSVDAAKKLTLMSNAKATLLPFLFNEAYSIILFESLLLGTPVISTPVGAIPEMMTDRVGFTAPIPEWERFPEVIKSIDREQCHKFAVERYDIRVCADKYLKAFADTLDGVLW